MSILEHLDLTPLDDAPAQAIMAELEMPPPPQPKMSEDLDQQACTLVSACMMAGLNEALRARGIKLGHVEIGAYMAMEQVLNTLRHAAVDKPKFKARTLKHMAKLITRTVGRPETDERF